MDCIKTYSGGPPEKIILLCLYSVPLMTFTDLKFYEAACVIAGAWIVHWGFGQQ